MSITKIASFKGQKSPPLSVPYYDFELVDDTRSFISAQADSVFSTGAGLYVENVSVPQSSGKNVYTNKILRVNLYRAFKMADNPDARQFFLSFDYSSNRSNSTGSSMFMVQGTRGSTISGTTTKGPIHVEIEFDFIRGTLRYRIGMTSGSFSINWALVDEDFSIDFFVPSNSEQTTSKVGDIRATWLFTGAVFTTKTNDATPFSFYGLSPSYRKLTVNNIVTNMMPVPPTTLANLVQAVNSTVTSTSTPILTFNSATVNEITEFTIQNPITLGMKVEALHAQFTYAAGATVPAGARAVLKVMNASEFELASAEVELVRTGARIYQANLLLKDVDVLGRQFTYESTPGLNFKLQLTGITQGQVELYQIQFFYYTSERKLKPSTTGLFPDMLASYTPLRVPKDMSAGTPQVVSEGARNTSLEVTADANGAYRGTAVLEYDRIPLEVALPIRTYDLQLTTETTTAAVVTSVQQLNGTVLNNADFVQEVIPANTTTYTLKPTPENLTWNPAFPVEVGDLEIPLSDILRLTYLPGFNVDTKASRLIGLLPFSATNIPGEITDYAGGVVTQSGSSNLVDGGRFADKALQIATAQDYVEVKPTRVTNTLWTRMSTECFVYFTGNLADLNGVIFATDTGAELYIKNGNIYYADSDYSGLETAPIALAGRLIPNQWNHLGICYSSFTWRLLINGKSIRLPTPSTLYDPFWNGGSAYRIGNSYDFSRNGGERPFLGKISEFRWCHGESYYDTSSSSTELTYVVPTAPFEI